MVIDKSPEKYEKEIKALKKSIKENERQAGMSLEELRIKVTTLTETFEKNKREMEDLLKLGRV